VSTDHEFSPWKFNTEYAPVRWARRCRTCHLGLGHAEVSPSPLPPASALAEMPEWERAAVEGLSAAYWVTAAASSSGIRERSGFPDWLNK
jgi:hypothetical protein